MSEIKEINIQIGQVRIAKGDVRLRTILGSCVGIGLIWRERRVCGLAHCLLPVNPKKEFIIDARYVTQAVPSLAALMHIRGADAKQVEAVLAGGGNMTAPDAADQEALVGANNVKAAREELEKLGVRVIFEDVFGEVGRKMSIDCWSFEHRVERIPRIIKAA